MDTNKLNLLKTYIGAKAKENDSMAQFDLAQFFLSKEGFAENNADTIDDANTFNSDNKQSIIIDEFAGHYWLMRAAINNNRDAIQILIEYYKQKKDNSYLFDELFDYYKDQIRYWLKKLADQDDAEAQYDYAFDLYGDDNYIAFDYFKKSASKQYLPAINYLGNCYYFGRGVEKDYKKAFELFEEASTAGYWEATENLAMCYMKGNGVEVSKEKMKELFELAKKQKSF